MKKTLYIVFMLGFWFIPGLRAQYITLPDPVFANFIASAYPTVCNASKQLDTTAAKLVTGAINAGNKGFTSVYGLQYFHKVNSVILNRNSLTAFPAIPKLTQLSFLNLDSNNLTTLPDLRPNVNLAKLWVSYNNLNSLPPMNGMNSITQLLCHHNQLTALPDMTGMTSLYHFVCSDNLISALPDMSTLNSLYRFLIATNRLEFADLTGLSNLHEVSLRANRLKTFPVITGMTQLTELMLHNNYIDSIPDLSSFTNLTVFDIYKNNLSFEDLIPLTTHPAFANFEISPQWKLGTSDTLSSRVNRSLTISFPYDLSLNSNQWIWYKDDVPFDTTNTGSLQFDTVQLGHSGSYYAVISNNTAGIDTVHLRTRTITLDVNLCMDYGLPSYQIVGDQCHYPVRIQLDETGLTNADFPVRYILKNSVTGSTSEYPSSQFSIPSQGIYSLTLVDASDCEVHLEKFLNLYKEASCEAVIYPDRNGPESSYFIPLEGVAKVYDSDGKLQAEFNAPAYWNGKTNAGASLRSGLYIIIVNGETKFQINIMH